MWVESFTGDNNNGFQEFLRFNSTDGDYSSPGDMIPAVFVNIGGYIIVRSQIGNDADYRFRDIHIQAKIWTKIDIKQYVDNKKVFLLYIFLKKKNK